MASASPNVDGAALLLLHDIKEGLQNGRIPDLDAIQVEIEAAIAKLDSKQLPEEPTQDDHITELRLETKSLCERVTQCETQIAKFRDQTQALKEETAEIVSRTEACNLLVEQQRKENAQLLTAAEDVKAIVSAPQPCRAPVHVDLTSRPAPPRGALISFPGGPRTVTIHPPGSPGYQSVIHDKHGDVIIDFRRSQPLRREGAFREPFEGVDRNCHRRIPEPPTVRALPPVPRWLDAPEPDQPASRPALNLRDIMTLRDFWNRLGNVKSPSPPTDASSSSSPTRGSRASGSEAKSTEVSSSLPSTPPSPSEGRGKKRTLNTYEADDDEQERTKPSLSLFAEPENVNAANTLSSAKHKESQLSPPEGPTKRKKRRSLEAGEQNVGLLELASVTESELLPRKSFLDPTVG